MKKFFKSLMFSLILAYMLAGYVSADGSFNPQGEVTRAQFVKMLVQAMEYKKIDSVSFVDMKPYPSSKPHWASVYVETALRNGVIIKAEEGDRFHPDAPITRKDMVMMICRALKLEPSDGPNPYFDLDEPDGYFTRAYEEYLVRGIPMNGKIIFNPTGVTTRAQAEVIIARLVDYKTDPEGFVAKAAMEERIANGTATAEDLEIVRQSEIDKAKADPNYIMEPKLSICNKEEDFAGMAMEGLTVEELFDNFAGYIRLDNYTDYEKYSSDIQLRLVNVDKGKELLNTITYVTQPFISYDHRYEKRMDEWNSLEDALTRNNNLGGYILRFVTRNEEKAVKGKFARVLDYVKKGETLNYKLYLKRGTNTEEYDIKLKVN